MFPFRPLLALLAAATVAHAEPKPLWDGKSLAGWHVIGKGTWTVEDGAIVGRHDKGEKEYSHLVSDAAYSDFTLRLQFKTVAGNSGVYFRIDEDPNAFSGVSGFQAEIDPVRDTGGLYETNGRSWVVQPTPEQVKSWFKPGEWNEMTITAQGAKVTVRVNGQITADIDDPKGRSKGRIALQTHAGQEGLVYFKDLAIEGTPVVAP